MQVGADDRRDPAEPSGTEQGVRFGTGGHAAHPCRAPAAHPGQDGPPDEPDRGGLDEHQAGVEQPGCGAGSGGQAGAGVTGQQRGQGSEQLCLGGERPAGTRQQVGQCAGCVRREDEDEDDGEARAEGDLPGGRVGGAAS